MAEDLAGFICSRLLEKPTIIGHSMGAKAAMALALQYPSLVRDIISVDNAPVDASLHNDFARYVQGMQKVELAGVEKQSEADLILQEYVESLPTRQFLLGNLSRTAEDKILKSKVPLNILGRNLRNMGDFPFKDPKAVRFEKPALFVRGTQSKYISDEALPVIGEFFPRFECVDIEAGHWVISENPEAFRNAVVEFLTPKE